MDHHEAAAADIAGARITHRKRKAHRNGRIDGIATLLQNGGADARAESLLRHDHAVLSEGTLRTETIILCAVLVAPRGRRQREKPGKRETNGAAENAIVKTHCWDKRLALQH
jgi:hypothetical protein